jgi:sugar lactone lactonase YvrE
VKSRIEVSRVAVATSRSGAAALELFLLKAYTIKKARRPRNVAFAGPDKRTLYITAREGWRVQTLTRGPERLGK